MKWIDLKNKAYDAYHPALFLNKVLPFSAREKIHKLATGLFLLLGFGTLIVFTMPLNISAYLTNAIFGLFLLSIVGWIISNALQAFFYSYYFKTIPDGKDQKMPIVSFELAELLYKTSPDDLIGGFITTSEGLLILRRSGILAADLKNYLENRTTVLSGDMVLVPDIEYLTFTQYAELLYTSNAEFSKLLFTQSIQKKDFLAICDWVIEREIVAKKYKRWWSREKLGRIPGIGKTWSYGRLYQLEKFERELPSVASSDFETHAVAGDKELQMIESILIRQHEANVFVVGNDIDGKLNLVAKLAQMIEEGTALPELEHKKVVMIDTDLVSAAAPTKNDFEQLLMTLMSEAATAGNIILVFPDFPSFITSGQALGVDVSTFLDTYFTSPELQIIALTDIDRYHSVIERNPALMERFDHVVMEEVDAINTLRILQNKLIEVEDRYGIFFTYSALATLVSDADRYITSGVMPDKAVNLLLELAPIMVDHHRPVVRKQDVEEVVHLKTGVPVGQIGQEEREKLLGLEDKLHQRIIGQNEAVSAIAQAVRRARSGINNPNRPMASFLFLGPTGVGKTETTKALADVFFGNVAMIERLDMSEYSGPDALEKLIGSYSSNTVGVLSKMIKEHQYGVLLLDEFEKTTPEVMNLFLQILDEGFFSDMTGKKVNARNLLIIATSNAGADLIWEAVKKGNDLSHSRDLIIDSLVHANIFRPELLNRFDGVIIFHPLENSQLEKVARLQLENLRKRISERGLNLIVNDDLVKYVMKFGADPKFGARPMARAVQDKVEQVIANKLISGEAQPGSDITISTAELNG